MERHLLHTFTMGDVEDPDIYASAALFEWRHTKKGEWAMEHGTDIMYHISPDDHSYGHKVKVTGLFTDKQMTWLRLNNT